MSDDVDALLSQPLPSVADAGFSARTLARIDRWAFHNWLIDAAAVTVCAVMGFLLVPVPALGDLVARLTPQLAASAPVGLALGAILLTLCFERLLRPL
ncbi:MAG TPA: hypothetical protein VHU87_04010 [Rhizomicrobium sp.]|nr:hypothetical protein [Rhizomicrobium sp.]